MLAVVEALPEPIGASWAGCTNRRFSIGYDGGDEPRALEHTLSNRLLGQAAALGASIGVTIYAPDPAAGK